MSRKSLDYDAERVAEAIREGNRRSVNDVGGIIVTYYVYRFIYMFTIPMNVFAAYQIGDHTSAGIGWGLFIINQILSIIRPKTSILITIITFFPALVIAVGP